ncbi:MAG: AbrB/MazE/SpoVT family DNA-binding domain-containing protein [Steroidobacter sp.]
MNAVTVTSRFQITIPQSLRKEMGIRPGQRFQAFQYQNRIELVRVISMRKARGMFKGIDTSVERERS